MITIIEHNDLERRSHEAVGITAPGLPGANGIVPNAEERHIALHASKLRKSMECARRRGALARDAKRTLAEPSQVGGFWRSAGGTEEAAGAEPAGRKEEVSAKKGACDTLLHM